jgi:hypothetical protein
MREGKIAPLFLLWFSVSCMFYSLLVGVKLNHAVMEQYFQHCTTFKLLSYTLGYAFLSDEK